MNFEYRSHNFDIQGVTPEDFIYKQIKNSKTFYEEELLNYLYALRWFITVKGLSNVIIDVGANIGNHSIFFGAFMADQVISIEPNPSVLSVLHGNLSKNLDNYTVCPVAVGEKMGRGVVMIPEGHEDNVGMAQIISDKASGGSEIQTLDSIFSKWKVDKSESAVVTLVKIDVEGMELSVLKGALEIIRQHKPHILAEAATLSEAQALNNFLEPLGYSRLLGCWAATPVYHFAYKPKIIMNLLASYLQMMKKFKSLINVIKRIRF